MGLLGGLTGNYGKTDTSSKYNKNMWTPEQAGVAKSLGTQIQGGFDSNWQQGQTQPTSYENLALGKLQSYLQGGNQNVTDTLNRAMTGQGYADVVDPKATQALYDALYKKTMEQTLPETTRTIANQANLQGMLNSGKGLQLQLKNQNDITTNLANTLAQLKYADEQAKRDVAMQREGRQLPAAQQAEAQQQNQISAGMNYGSLPRTLQGQEYNNPLTQLALYFLGLRGQESGTGSSNTTAWNLGGSGGFGIE